MAQQQFNAAQYNHATLSLRSLFVILSTTCVFFAVLNLSAVAALLMTVFIVPAMIRTAWASDLHRRESKLFGWRQLTRYFCESVAVIVATLTFGGTVFVLICLAFGLLGLLFGMMVAFDLCLDAAVMGATGGIIWGMAGGMMAIGYSVLKIWQPRIK